MPEDYSHRKDWVLERLRTLAEVFAVDIAAFAILSNHYHLVGKRVAVAPFFTVAGSPMICGGAPALA